MTYKTTRDIIIPAGTIIDEAPAQVMRFVSYAEAMLDHGPDICSSWTMPLDEAIEVGLVEKVND